MIAADPYLVVRASSIYVTTLLTIAAWLWHGKGSGARPLIAGSLLAFAWNLPVLLLVNVAAQRFGWWRFDAKGGLLLGVPVDFLLAWIWLWSVVPLLAFEALAIGAIAMVALAFDLIVMPAAAPVLRLGPLWLAGEVVALAAGLVPGLLLARMTMRDKRLPERAVLQVIAFSGITLFVLPAIIIEATGVGWTRLFERPTWQICVIMQGLAIPAIIGLSAVQEFVTRGAGTPVPYDPPRRIVTTGLYAYVRNPMQLSAVLLLCLLGLALQNVWLAGAGIMAHIYSVGLAGWDEDDDLNKRFGSAWTTYRRGVRAWWPRVRPWRPDGRDDLLYVAEGCGMCSEVGRWFQHRGVQRLEIVPAEHHPSRALTRITYESSDGAYTASGIEAVARALEHVHIGWALIACVLRLPVVRPLTQIIVDASGGEPRRIAPRPVISDPSVAPRPVIHSTDL